MGDTVIGPVEAAVAAETQLIEGSRLSGNTTAGRSKLLSPISGEELRNARQILAEHSGTVDQQNYAALVDALALGRSLRSAIDAKDGPGARKIITEAAQRVSTINQAYSTLSPLQLNALVNHLRNSPLLQVMAQQVAAQDGVLAPFLASDVHLLRQAITDPEVLRDFNKRYIPARAGG